MTSRLGRTAARSGSSLEAQYRNGDAGPERPSFDDMFAGSTEYSLLAGGGPCRNGRGWGAHPAACKALVECAARLDTRTKSSKRGISRSRWARKPQTTALWRSKRHPNQRNRATFARFRISLVKTGPSRSQSGKKLHSPKALVPPIRRLSGPMAAIADTHSRPSFIPSRRKINSERINRRALRCRRCGRCPRGLRPSLLGALRSPHESLLLRSALRESRSNASSATPRTALSVPALPIRRALRAVCWFYRLRAMRLCATWRPAISTGYRNPCAREPISSVQPLARTKSISLAGKLMTVGGSIIMPMLISVEATTMSITRNGR